MFSGLTWSELIWLGIMIIPEVSINLSSSEPCKRRTNTSGDIMRFFQAVITIVYWHGGAAGAAVNLKKPHHIANL